MVNFGALNVGISGMQAQLTALQTIGHNIANANDPAYSRQRVIASPSVTRDMQFGQIGTGVQVTAIQRLVDQNVEMSLRDALSDLGLSELTHETYQIMETIFNELSGAGVTDQLNEFFNAVDDVANQPGDIPARQVLVEQARSLADSVAHIYDRLRETREALNSEVTAHVNRANELMIEIAELNDLALASENGGIDIGAANDLRDRRDQALRELSQIIDVTAIETSRGDVNVLVGGEFLVFGSRAFTLATRETVDRGSRILTPFIEETGGAIQLNGGELAGAIKSRDEILVSFMDDLNELANGMIYEFNRIHSEGFGLSRYQNMVSEHGVETASIGTLPLAIDGTVTGQGISTTFTDTGLIGLPDLTGQKLLITSGNNRLQVREIVGFDSQTGTVQFDRAFDHRLMLGDEYQVTGLPFAIENGSFNFELINEVTGTQQTFNIEVNTNLGINRDVEVGGVDVLTDSDLAGARSDDFYIGATIHFTSGPNAGEIRRVTDYDGATGLFTLDASNPLPNPVGAGDTFEIYSPLEHIRNQIDMISGVSATIDVEGRLDIQTSNAQVRFSFSNDTSGFLAAMGMNNFFTGTGGENMGVSAAIQADVTLIAAAQSLNPSDNSNALALTALRDADVMVDDTISITEYTLGVINRLATESQSSTNRFENNRAVAEQITNQRQRISGVDINEEAADLIVFQRAFEASAKYIQVIDELLNTLINGTI
jgi:flagellar hook-associated protein 1 FlgK